MKILSKKGFILVETLVVTLFISILFILVYQNLVPSIGEYQTMVSYDDIDSVYASNLWKQSLLRYGNMDYIDSYLTSHTYLNITDCNDTNIYKNSEYCEKIKKSLSILEDDYIFITNYNIHDFRQEVKNDDFFDSGKLSDFRNYIGTVSDTDSFYDETDDNTIVGKYRLFMTRTVTNADKSTSLKYANLGIYTGKYKRYNMGEIVTFAPGSTTGNMNFYVLKNSSSNESTVTLILDRNIGNVTLFNPIGTIGAPTQALAILKNNTNSWNKVNMFTADNRYVSSNGYTISYNGYRARFLEPNDIYEIFGNRLDKKYFDENTLFSILFNDDSINFLSNQLTGSSGYWMANMVSGNSEMAWTIQDKKITPVFIQNNTDIGVRPVIVVSKEQLG